MKINDAVAEVGPAPTDKALIELYVREFNARAESRFKHDPLVTNDKVLQIFEEMKGWIEAVATRAGRTPGDAVKVRMLAAARMLDYIHKVGQKAKSEAKKITATTMKKAAKGDGLVVVKKEAAK